jgi:hypothetical protein
MLTKLIGCAALAVMAIAFALTAGSASGSAPLAGPPNDMFASAEALTDRFGYLEASNVEATREPDEPYHAGNQGGASVWYVWTAPHRGRATVSTCNYSEFDTVLAVYTGDDLSDLQEVASNDDGCGQGSRVSFVTAPGETYRIAVDGADGATGLFWLDYGLGPTHDDFADAVDIAGDSGVVEGDNIMATLQDGEPEHGAPGGASVWYRWTAPSTGPATFDLCDSYFDTLLAVYTGSSVSGLTQIAANDEDCDSASRVSFQASAGTTYSIAVDGYYGDLGDVVLRWSRTAIPPRNSMPPAVLGTPVDGATLASAVGEWGGTPPFSYGYQWLRCSLSGFGCQALPGATASTYGLTSAEVGYRLRVAVTATNAAGATTEISEPTGIVSSVAPRSLGLPTISGDPYVGDVLSTDEGQWSGTRPFAFALLWQRCDSGGGGCAPIDGETDSTYTIRSEDVGATLRIAITVSNGAGSATAVSEPTPRVTQRPVAPTKAVRCLVPKVRGKMLKAARRAIRRANCSLGRVRYARSGRARGRVIAQSPRPGARRPRGTRVSLVVSRGRQR